MTEGDQCRCGAMLPAAEKLEDELLDLIADMNYSIRNVQVDNFIEFGEEFVKAFLSYRELVQQHGATK